MSLRIKDVAFDDFRSYEHFRLSDIGPLTVLVGPNAVGKTNVVEGIQLLTAQTSFRNPTGVQLVREGTAFARLRATAVDESRLLELGLTIEAGKRRFTLNGKQKRTADLKGVIPSVTFTPDDLNLAKGSGTTRRNALDAVGSQLSRNHYLIRRDFDKVLRHKNSLLKDEASPLLLESLNDLMVTCGAQLVCYRAALFGKLAASMASYYAEIVGNRETLSARYAPSWLAEGEWLDAGETLDRDEARERFAAALAGSMAQERARHRALVGPHADRIEFFIEGRPVGVYGSQGQQRSAVLAFKLAEVTLICDLLGQQPVLLLDDVMSELDEQRRRALVKFVSGDIQTFITTANLAYFDEDLLAAARVVRLPLERKDGE